MKKTLTINLNGTVFHIDEDAYELLDEYLCNLHIYFNKDEDSEEIIADFEARIAELFNERVRLGYNVISIEQVKEVIEKIGKPEDFGDPESYEEEKKSYGTQSARKIKKKLYRDVDDKMFGGVSSGIAAYFGWDPAPLRIILFILIFVTSLWIIPVYLLLWIFIPGAKTAEQKLEMRGEEVTIENIGKAVSEPPAKKRGGFIEGLLDFIVAVIKVFAVGLGCLVGIPLVFALVVVLIVLFAVMAGLGEGLFGGFLGFESIDLTLGMDGSIPLFISLILVAGIPLVALVYYLVAYFGKLKPLPPVVKKVSLLVWVISLILFVILGFKQLKDEMKDGFRWEVGNVRFNNSGGNVIEGNGVLADIDSIIPAFKNIQMSDNLFANIRLVQEAGPDARIQINGDENLVDKIEWETEDDMLKLYVKDNYILNSTSGLIVKVSSPAFEQIKMPAVGSVTIENSIHSERMLLELEGAAKFSADSLFVDDLQVKLDGVGAILLKGKSKKAKYELKGAGKIEASDLESDTVIAVLRGVGAVKSNPLLFLDAKVDGIGKITYKDEPESKKTSVQGMGKIEKKP